MTCNFRIVPSCLSAKGCSTGMPRAIVGISTPVQSDVLFLNKNRWKTNKMRVLLKRAASNPAISYFRFKQFFRSAKSSVLKQNYERFFHLMQIVIDFTCFLLMFFSKKIR